MTQEPITLQIPGNDNGFTLIEILVALTILSLSVVVLFGIFSQAIDQARQDNSAMRARVLAEALLKQAEASAPTQDTHGVEAFGLEWWVHAQPFGDDDDKSAGPNVERVSATVRWNAAAHSRSLTLTTLAFAPNETDR